MSPQPAWVIFTEMRHTSKVQIKDLTEIDPVWLEVLASHYYEKVSMRS
jgi:ATP-dependent RNA helicase DDX35